MRVIGPTVRQDLNIIRRIRNHAAHHMEEFSFATPEIANRCRELQMAKEATATGVEPSDARVRFLVTVEFFTANLLLRSGDHMAEIAEVSRILAPSLDR